VNIENKKRVRIGKNFSINADEIFIGDGVFIGDNVTIDAPNIRIDDYTLIRENTQILGKKPCNIGMCCWIGQGCIIDATENLEIGNGVGIGAHSQLWTHIRFGDIVQGCQWESEKKMLIEDDVWFVGHCMVSPIHAAKGSMAMLGSVVTNDMLANHIYAGVPAKDVTDKLGTQFKEISINTKYEMMQEQLKVFNKAREMQECTSDFSIQIVKEWPSQPSKNVSYFNVSNRQYTKNLSDIEMDFMLHLLTTIKFYPRND